MRVVPKAVGGGGGGSGPGALLTVYGDGDGVVLGPVQRRAAAAAGDPGSVVGGAELQSEPAAARSRLPAGRRPAGHRPGELGGRTAARRGTLHRQLLPLPCRHHRLLLRLLTLPLDLRPLRRV